MGGGELCGEEEGQQELGFSCPAGGGKYKLVSSYSYIGREGIYTSPQ